MANLYDTDFCHWAETQADLVRQEKFSELDIENVAEELEGLSRSDRHQLINRLQVLLAHLLKLSHAYAAVYPAGQNPRSWRISVFEQRRRLNILLADSPSLAPQVPEIISQIYDVACYRASGDTDLPVETFPESCPWTTEQVLDEVFWP